MERFIPYHIDRQRLDKAKVRVRKGLSGFYSLSANEEPIEVPVTDLLKAGPRDESTPRDAWATEDGGFILDGETYAVDTSTPAGATVEAMVRFADLKTLDPSDTSHFPSDFHRFYFVESTRMPESWRSTHVFFDFAGRVFQLFDCAKPGDATAFMVLAGEWSEVDATPRERQVDRALRLRSARNAGEAAPIYSPDSSSGALEGTTLDEWLEDWLPASLAAYQTFLHKHPVYANAIAIELVIDTQKQLLAEADDSWKSSRAFQRHTLLTLMCLPQSAVTWVRAIQTDRAERERSRELATRLVGVQSVLSELRALCVIVLAILVLGLALTTWLLLR